MNALLKRVDLKQLNITFDIKCLRFLINETSFSHFPVFKKTFHTTSILLGGRKGGSSANEPSPRRLSKKQKKRKQQKRLLLLEKRDPKKEKIQDMIVKKQVESDNFRSAMTDAEEKLSDLFNTLQLPSSNIEMQKLLKIGKNVKEVNNKALNPKNVIIDLKTLCVENKLILPSDKPHKFYDNIFSALSTEIQYKIEDIDSALFILKDKKKYKDVAEILYYMSKLKIPYSNKTYNIVLHLENNYYNNFTNSLVLFDQMIKANISPTIYTWIEVINAYVQSNQIDSGLYIINNILKKSNINVPIDTYIVILKKYLELEKFEELVDLWVDMHTEDFSLTIESFHVMLKYCIKTSQVEKAFFYYDEIVALKLDASIETYRLLIRACAEAPHWVNGYHDIIFDAISKLEGSELKPTVGIYNAIIHAFGKAGDAMASEYYFWEMMRKNIKPITETYNSLFYAYARSNSVGASDYGYNGRYVRPLERKYTPDEQAAADLGPKNLIKHLSSGINISDKTTGGKRQKPIIEDELDDDEDFSRSILDDIRAEAKELNKSREKSKLKLENNRKNNLLTHKQNHGLNENDLSVSVIDSEDNDTVDEDDDELNDVLLNSIDEVEDDDDNEEIDPSILKMLNENSEMNDDDIELTPEEQLEYDKIMSSLGSDEEFTKLFSNMRDSSSEITSKHRIKKSLTDSSTSIEPEEKASFGRKKRPLPRRNKPTNNATSNTTEKSIDDNTNEEDNIVSHNVIDIADKELDEYLKNSNKEDPDSENINYKELFKQKFNVDPNIRIIQRSMKLANSFEDPFVGVLPVKGALVKYDSLNDNDPNTITERNKLLSLLDANSNELSKSKSNSMKTHEELVDLEWDLVEYGTAPDPDYSIPLSRRREIFINRAKLALEHMKSNKININIVTLTSYLSVFAEALHPVEAMNVFKSITTDYNMRHTDRSYAAIIRMFVRLKDISTAIKHKNDMIQNGLIPLPETYGLLLESYVHREHIVEAILLLEEAANYKIKLPNKNLSRLRGRCNKLGIEHPDMPEDPLEWLKILRKVRKQMPKTSSSKVEAIRSALSF